MRLIPSRPVRSPAGIRFRGHDLLRLSEPAMRRIRGNEIGMIFQEPMSSLNPLLTVGEQIAEVVRLHAAWGVARRDGARWRCWRGCNIPDPTRRAAGTRIACPAACASG